VPSSALNKGRGSIGKRGAKPLSRIFSFLIKEVIKSLRETKPLLKNSPPLLFKERGIKGVRLIDTYH